MEDWKPYLLVLTDGQGNFKAVTIQGESFEFGEDTKTGVVTQPTPEVDRIAKEKLKDLTGEGIIKSVIKKEGVK